ncbi:MAG: hypothetical protein PHF86_04330 [Candidatus Nanoarchaeia archaeon]|nr:hypothetical protein [Candidatus Nanoarchaeia archaeon]
MIAFKKNGEAWSWGYNGYGGLGVNDTQNKSSPVQIVGNHSFIFVMSGFAQSYFIKSDNNVWCCGNGQYMGAGNTSDYSSPVVLIGNHQFIKISTSYSYSAGTITTVGLKSNGEAWSWGYNGIGQLGTGNTTSTSSPVKVIGNHSFIYVHSGHQYLGLSSTFGIKSNGEAWCWGCNSYGALGVNDTQNRSSPIQIAGNHSFILIKSGFYFAMGLKSNGEAWSWGFNGTGQLGTGDTTRTSSPVKVIGDHSFIFIDVSQSSSLGLKSNGEVWSWGQNAYGQLGTGNTTSTSSPVKVIGNHSFISIKAFETSSLGLKSNGEIWSWGYNYYGQLGIGNTSNASSPVKVIGNHSFISINTGMNIRILDNSSWHQRPIGFIRKSGAWRRLIDIYIKKDSVWKTTDRLHK